MEDKGNSKCEDKDRVTVRQRVRARDGEAKSSEGSVAFIHRIRPLP